MATPCQSRTAPAHRNGARYAGNTPSQANLRGERSQSDVTCALAYWAASAGTAGPADQPRRYQVVTQSSDTTTASDRRTPGLPTWREIWCDVENSKSFRSSHPRRVSQGHRLKGLGALHNHLALIFHSRWRQSRERSWQVARSETFRPAGDVRYVSQYETAGSGCCLKPLAWVAGRLTLEAATFLDAGASAAPGPGKAGRPRPAPRYPARPAAAARTHPARNRQPGRASEPRAKTSTENGH